MIDSRAVISPQAEIAADVQIGPFTVIGPDVVIGAGTWVGPHAVINGPTRSFGISASARRNAVPRPKAPTILISR